MDLDCLAEARGLEFHRAMAAMLRREPAMVAKGRERVREWRTEGSVHVIRASASIAEDDEIIVIGSQAILGQFPDAPAEILVSMEADVFPSPPERSGLIDGSIGEGSPFHEAFGSTRRGWARRRPFSRKAGASAWTASGQRNPNGDSAHEEGS
jgi:hypothetical protein